MVDTRTPAARLVLACACVHPDAQRRDAIARLAAGRVDWHEALDLASRHGLAPLLHRHLSMPGMPAVAKAVAAPLWARAEWAARRNRAMAAELVEILEALQREGVAAIPYKGPTLTLQVYGDLGLREFGDLDVLVASADLGRARAILDARGYAPHHPLPPHVEAAWTRSPRCYELPLVDVRRGFMVELQWRGEAGQAPIALDDSRWWESLPRHDFLGCRVTSIAPAESFITLLVHGSKHAWSNLGWLVDISEIMKRNDLEWPRVFALARECHAVRRAALGLELAHRLLEAPLPEGARALIEEAGIASLSEAIESSILSPQPAARPILTSLRLQLEMLDSPIERARHVAMQILTPGIADFERWGLPPRLSFLAWILRPLRLAEKYLFNAPRPRSPAGATLRTPPPRRHSTG